MLLSVVVPFHTRALLDRMISSVLPQLDADSELIMVGDGIEDRVAQQLKDEYPQITWYTIPKSGGNSARTYGIKMARGKYILLSDSDDVLHADALSVYCNVIIQHSPDLIIANVERMVEGKPMGHFFKFKRTEKVLSKSELHREELYYLPILICKCFKKKYAEGIDFEDSSMFQDINITSKLFKNIQSLYYTNTITYLYHTRQNSTSAIASDTKERISCALPSIEGVEAYYKSKILSSNEKCFLSFIIIRFYHTLIRRSIFLNDFKFSNQLRKKACSGFYSVHFVHLLIFPKAFLIGLMLKNKLIFGSYYYFILNKGK